MLAREIHDVAGEIDSVSPAATDPGILVFKSINRPQPLMLLTTTNCDMKMKCSLLCMHLCVKIAIDYNLSFISFVSVCRRMCLTIAWR